MSNKQTFSQRMASHGRIPQDFARCLHPHLTRSRGSRLLKKARLLPNVIPFPVRWFFRGDDSGKTEASLPCWAAQLQTGLTGRHPNRAWVQVVEYALFGLKLLKEEAGFISPSDLPGGRFFSVRGGHKLRQGKGVTCNTY